MRVGGEETSFDVLVAAVDAAAAPSAVVGVVPCLREVREATALAAGLRIIARGLLLGEDAKPRTGMLSDSEESKRTCMFCRAEAHSGVFRSHGLRLIPSEESLSGLMLGFAWVLMLLLLLRPPPAGKRRRWTEDPARPSTALSVSAASSLGIQRPGRSVVTPASVSLMVLSRGSASNTSGQVAEPKTQLSIGSEVAAWSPLPWVPRRTSDIRRLARHCACQQHTCERR